MTSLGHFCQCDVNMAIFKFGCVNCCVFSVPVAVVGCVMDVGGSLTFCTTGAGLAQLLLNSLTGRRGLANWAVKS